MLQKQAIDVLKTGANVFLTGEPGSGKTYTIRSYIDYLRQMKVGVAVVASTGIAATHLGGMTIHAWSGIGIKRDLSKYDVDRIATTQRIARRIGAAAVLVIDEVSMLDGRVLESVDKVCREVKGVDEAFGGMQVVLVGDFFQLPPVSKAGEDPAQFAFDAGVWEQARLMTCYLSEQHRQEDDVFLSILQAVRESSVTDEHRWHLDKRASAIDGVVNQDMPRLFSHNVDVDAVNDEKLGKLPGAATVFRMKESGKAALVAQLKRGCLSPERLALKDQARVMFTKNSPKQEFVNGTLGTVAAFAKNKCPIVETMAGKRITVEPMEWTVEDNGRILARIMQFPLRLAWAMTVHKSQGMSLDAAMVDLQQAFEVGQGYVALSRVRTLKGLFLVGYNEQALRVHPDVIVRDGQFRELSEQARAVFAKLPAAELKEMHRNFIRAAGGKVAKKKFSVKVLREKYPNAYRPWGDDEDALLEKLFGEERKTKEMAAELGRQPGAVRARLRKLEIVE